MRRAIHVLALSALVSPDTSSTALPGGAAITVCGDSRDESLANRYEYA
jgi:hypothetical protein